MNDLWLVGLIALGLINPDVRALEVGETCIIEISGETGTCQLHNDCPEIEELGRRNLKITLCGFHQLTEPIVCCKKPRLDIVFPGDEPTAESETSSFSSNSALRKSEQKCAEYSKSITDRVVANTLIAPQPDYQPEGFGIEIVNCDYNKVPLIVGGSPAGVGEYPFMVAIGYGDETPNWSCGGSLISDRWVLTAGHCTNSREFGEPKWLRLGALDMSKPTEEGRIDYFVDQIVPHPNYRYPIKYNDIALISTSTPVTFSKFIRPACLYTQPTLNEKFAMAAGWGQQSFLGSQSDVLLKVALNVHDNSICQRAYQNEIKMNWKFDKGVTDTMLCAGELKGGKDTCLGDSGGPLFINQKGNMCKFYIIGITSFGKICGQENVPAIYTRVSEYVDWIENTIW